MMHRHVHGGKCHAPLRSSLVILATRDHARCHLRRTSGHCCTSTGTATPGSCEGGILPNSEGEPFMDRYAKDSASRVVMRRAAASDRTSAAFPRTRTTHAQAERLPRSLETDVTKEPASVLTVRCNILEVSCVMLSRLRGTVSRVRRRHAPNASTVTATTLL